MNTRKLLLSTVLLSAVFASCKKDKSSDPAPVVQENISGEVSGTWAKNGTYKVSGSIIIPEGKSLTIEEGATVIMVDSNAKPEIIVKGNLYCTGTAANPIHLTIPEEMKGGNQWGGLWGGIIAAPTCAELLLEYTEMDYGGAVTTEESASVKAGLYKAAAGEHVPALYVSNVSGKLVVQNCAVHNFREDGFYIEGGSVILDHNKFYTTGLDNGDAINIKSGVLADVAYNFVYSPNTNGLKLSNSGDRTPQAYVIGYNNTVVNAGWRRPTTKGGSIWLEKTVHVDLYNNLLANDRYGVKRDKGNPEDSRSIVGYTLYFGANQTCVDQFQPSDEILTGVNDMVSTTVGDNDPKFVNYPTSTDMANGTFNTAWDFHLQAGSPALNAGKTGFSRHFSTAITMNGMAYTSPEPATYIGAYGTN
ncbi:right-handed parallel beta-helix repeat-containing protein [Taibaiella soli]|uniref:Right-handed parallel beta-helix repeat-containing protein n=1 Tax=Taibaiella soli TaxID=1649169 RepID=A0A2W2C1Z6_9BACT|nr:right-handed parallel beta-helix repeat-containing protein [Taibaiella soli]PZF74093.1 right-handed parallel beta-helix repeat-containing protein [Taibaiella soli]